MSEEKKKGVSKIFRWGFILGLIFVIIYGFMWMTTDKQQTAVVKGTEEAGRAIVGQLQDGVTTDNELSRNMSRKQVNDKAANAEKENKSSVSFPLLDKEDLEIRRKQIENDDEAARLRRELEEERRRNTQRGQPQQQAASQENPYAGLILGATSQYLTGLKPPFPGELFLNKGIIEEQKVQKDTEKAQLMASINDKKSDSLNPEKNSKDPVVVSKKDMGKIGQLSAGTILYGMVEIGANSDQPGTPVMVQIVSGAFTGTKFIGEFVRQDEQLIVKFNRSVQNGQTFAANAFAIDPKTSRPGVRSDVDTHFWTKWGFRIASRFIEGLGTVITESGQSIYETQGGSIMTSNEQLRWKDKMLAAGGTVGKDISDHLDKNFDRPPTVTLDIGQEIGILLLE